MFNNVGLPFSQAFIPFIALRVSLMPLNEFFAGSGFRRPRPVDQASRGRHSDPHRCGSGVARHLSQVKHGGRFHAMLPNKIAFNF